MTQPPTPQDLDAALRQGARARRALLDEQAYPIGDYPPQHPEASTPRRPNVVWRAARTLGLTATLTAGLLLALNWVGQFVAAPPPGAVAENPPPESVIDSVRNLVARVDRAERTFNQQLDPALVFATAWPGQVRAWGESLGQPATLPAPMEQEIAAIRHDLLAAADYVREQWKAPPADGRAPGGPQAPANPGDPGPPTGRFPAPPDSVLGIAAGYQNLTPA